MSETMPEAPAGAATAPEGAEPPEAAEGAFQAPQEPEPHPLGVVRTPTGNADVDAALERLADADELPTEGHVEVYEDAHGQLRGALEELDRRPGPPPPGPAAAAAPAPGPYRG
ncbi:hypothetical protein AB0M28_21065 [Streptomyces sp. NPDC051940]|uniref:hypothetical protein n=1 Tax=Streptomyces sp. NPDC051940 TaxID=3155675 RepID=UPI003444E2B4